MSKKLPEITHLQFLVLEALDHGEQAGREVREILAEHGVRNSAPAFYQMMARLEQAGLVEGWYAQTVVNGQHLKERRYRIARAGARAVKATRNFYLQRATGTRVARKASNA